jgi:hypothetical protein
MAKAQVGLTTKAPFTLSPTDDEGNARKLENFRVESEGDVVQLEFDEATNSGFVFGDSIGTTPFEFVADAKIGEGESELRESHELEVTESEATGFGTSFGAAVPR